MINTVGVVGAGPAGVAAAIMLKRYGIEVLIFERRTVGGLLNNAWRVENFPPLEPCTGEELCRKLEDRLTDNDIAIINEEVTAIRDRIIVTRRARYTVDYTLVATGTAPKRLPSLETCSRVVYEYRDIPPGTEVVAIYGAGDMAFDGAVRASLRGSRTLLFSRSETLRAIEPLKVSAEKAGVELHRAESILRVEPDEALLKITTSLNVYSADVLLICIGRESLIPRIDSDRCEIIGDARGEIYRQASIAIGDGIKSAMKIALEG